MSGLKKHPPSSYLLRSDPEALRVELGRRLKQGQPFPRKEFDVLVTYPEHTDFLNETGKLGPLVQAAFQLLQGLARNEAASALPVLDSAPESSKLNELQQFEAMMQSILAKAVLDESGPQAAEILSSPAVASIRSAGREPVLDALAKAKPLLGIAAHAQSRWPLSWNYAGVEVPTSSGLRWSVEERDLLRAIRTWADVNSLTQPYPPEALVDLLLGYRMPEFEAFSFRWSPDPRLPLGFNKITIEVSPFVREEDFTAAFGRFRDEIAPKRSQMPVKSLLEATTALLRQPNLDSKALASAISDRYGEALMGRGQGGYFRNWKQLKGRIRKVIRDHVRPNWTGFARLDSEGMLGPRILYVDESGKPDRLKMRMPETPGRASERIESGSRAKTKLRRSKRNSEKNQK